MGKTVIEGSRAKVALIALLSVGFVAASWWLRGRAGPADGLLELVAWTGVALGVLGVAAAILLLVRPARLILRPESFTLDHPLKRRTVRWEHIAELFIWQVHSTRIVAFNYLPGHQPTDPMTAANASLGAPGNFGSSWNVSPEDLLELAVAYHRAAMPQLYGRRGWEPDQPRP